MNPSIGYASLATLKLGRDASTINELGPEDFLAPPPVPDSDGNAFFLLNTGVDYVKVMRDVRSMQGDLTWLHLKALAGQVVSSKSHYQKTPLL